MTVDDQLREVARRADLHQPAITAEEVFRRAAVHGTGASPPPNARRSTRRHPSTAFTDEETTMLDVTTSNHSVEHRKGPKLALVACLAAVAAVAVIAFVAARDDDRATTAGGPRTLAEATDVLFVGTEGLAGQTLNVSATEQDGRVTGEFRISSNAFQVECANTDTAGFVILGGVATTSLDVERGELMALIIKAGSPDAVALWPNTANASSCTELLASIPAGALTDESNFDVVEDGYDIITG